ncbi:MAG: hypothetical protein M1823_000791 [Watsoniomyces obsoletus]|nr:MAG: hypothetical protein M1823_000791 [Watsoniomyces obsoletus]
MATSPPYSHPSTLPPATKKRPSISTSDITSISKRRKPSLTSSTSLTSGFHPLRQTSFPPPEISTTPTSEHPREVKFSRSPSVDSAVTSNSLNKRRGSRKPSLKPEGSSTRRRKSRAANVSIDDGSLSNSRRGSTVGRGGGAGRDHHRDESATSPERVEEEEEEPDMNAVKNVMETDEDKERQRLKFLMEAFSTDQNDRYDAYRRGRLSLPIVKRLVNQTLSQSIPDNVAKTVAGFTKVFIGEIIERARDVQEQWDAVHKTAPSNAPPPLNTHNNINQSGNTQIPTPQASQTGLETETSPTTKEGDMDPDRKKNTSGYHGPLLPDHLREAVRRYRRDQEGGAAGMRMLSVPSMRGYSSATGGRRLFR